MEMITFDATESHFNRYRYREIDKDDLLQLQEDLEVYYPSVSQLEKEGFKCKGSGQGNGKLRFTKKFNGDIKITLWCEPDISELIVESEFTGYPSTPMSKMYHGRCMDIVEFRTIMKLLGIEDLQSETEPLSL